MQTAKTTILIIDDDPHIREVLRYTLEKEGIAVVEADNGQSGLEAVATYQPTVIILDIMMPEMNGFDFCQTLRKTSHTPILFLSSRSDEIDRVLGLELGGDDYMNKPFSPRELLARVKAMLRRQEYATQALQPKRLEYGAIQMDCGQFQVLYQSKQVILTVTEFNLLETFLRTPQKTYTRDELVLLDVFKDIVSDRTVDSHIRRLRQKFANQGCQTVIETAHGFGYKLGQCQ